MMTGGPVEQVADEARQTMDGRRYGSCE